MKYLLDRPKYDKKCGEMLEQEKSRNDKNEVIYDKVYKIERRIGEGSYGQTFLARTANNVMCVLKVIKARNIDDSLSFEELLKWNFKQKFRFIFLK